MIEAVLFLLGVLAGWLAAPRRAPRPGVVHVPDPAWVAGSVSISGPAGWLKRNVEADGTVTYTWTWAE